MKLKLVLEISPSQALQLIDLVSDAQNTHAERLSSSCIASVADDSPLTCLSKNVYFHQCRYREYTELLQMLHERILNAEVLRGAEDEEN